jgi:putative aldouronate transport system substrate-binding protein
LWSNGKGESKAAETAAPVKVVLLYNTSPLPPVESNPILQKLNEELDMKLEFNGIDTEYQQQLNIKLAGGTPPDLFMVDVVSLQTYSKQGLLADWGPYLENQMPNFMEWCDIEGMFSIGQIDGVQYALPKKWPKSNSVLMYRKDWLDTVGMDFPQSLDQLVEACRAFTFDDPNGNGVNDTYGLTGHMGLNSFLPIFAAYGIGGLNSFVMIDGNIQYSAVTPQMKEALGLLKDMVDEGIIDPEIIANKVEQATEKMIRGTAGIHYTDGPRYKKALIVEEYKAVNPAIIMDHQYEIDGPAGRYLGTDNVVSTYGLLSMPSTIVDKPVVLNKVIELIEYITPGSPGNDLVCYGLEGVHYTVENGNKVATEKMKELTYSWKMQIAGRDDAVYIPFKFPELEDMYTRFPTVKRVLTYNPLIPVPDGVVAGDKNTFEEDMLVQFIYGNRPLDEFDDFVQEMYDVYSLQLYIDKAEEVLKNKGYL